MNNSEGLGSSYNFYVLGSSWQSETLQLFYAAFIYCPWFPAVSFCCGRKKSCSWLCEGTRAGSGPAEAADSEDPCWARSDRRNDSLDTKICCFWLLFLLILLSAYSEHGIQETLTETVWKKEKESWCDLAGGSKTCGSNTIFTFQAWKGWPGNHRRVAALMVQQEEGRGEIKPTTFIYFCLQMLIWRFHAHFLLQQEVLCKGVDWHSRHRNKNRISDEAGSWKLAFLGFAFYCPKLDFWMDVCDGCDQSSTRQLDRSNSKKRRNKCNFKNKHADI